MAGVQDFTGGDDQLEASLGSFLREIPTRDGLRVYADSLLTTGSFQGGSTSADVPNIGTLRTEGSELRPKYYLNTRSHGQFADLIDQAKDSKSFPTPSKITGVVRRIRNVAMGAPVRGRFVSGSNSETTGVRIFTRVRGVETSLVNKPPTSRMSGSSISFFEAGAAPGVYRGWFHDNQTQFAVGTGEPDSDE